MKKLIILPVLILLLINIKSTCAWDSEAAKFYPLSIGNSWSYHRIVRTGQFCMNISSESDYIVSILSDTLMPNGKKYYKLSGGPYGNQFQRIDSATMRVYQYSLTGECAIDSLLSRKNNYFLSCRQIQTAQFQVLDTNTVTFAGLPRRARNIQGNQLIGHHYILMYGIGMYNEGACEFGGFTDLLNGCIINGVQYGQMLGVNNEQGNFPISFSLYQNYPNPFNPTTSIKFSVHQKSFVTITIFNVLGEEISKLVNEEFSPGTYETNWDASNYPSGVYYYKLTAKPSDRLEQSDGYTETKKMLMIK